MKDLLVTGTVVKVGKIQSFGNNGFQKMEVILEQDSGKYINYVPLEFTNEYCEKANELEEGMEVEAKFWLNGRKWQKDDQSEERYFVSLKVADFRILSKTQKVNNDVQETVNADCPF
tara:strand:- start:1575 stop:1925 length:351 start_codon:yes stop_codon:yes gene_type:complete